MPEPEDPSSVPSAPAFKVPGPAQAVLSVAALLSVLATLPRALAQATTAETVGFVFGVMLVATGVPTLVGWLAFRRAPGGVSRPVIITALTLLLVQVFSAVPTCEQIAARNKLHEAAVAVQALESGDPAGYEAATERVADALGAMAQAGGSEGLVFFAASTRDALAQQKAYDARLEAFNEGLDDPEDLASLARIDARREKVRLAREAGVVLLASARALPGELEPRMRGPEEQRMFAGFMRGYQESSRIAFPIREAELRMFAAYEQMLTLLREHFGQWTIDPAAGLVYRDEFPAADRQALDGVLDALERANAEIERLGAQSQPQGDGVRAAPRP